MYLSILILPFLGSISAGFLGRKIGITGSQIISCTCLFLSAVLSTIAFYEVCLCASPVNVYLGKWIDSELMLISWEFLFDQISVIFCIMITYITFLILVYTVYYMEGSPHIQRFFSYLSALAGFMLVLVTGANYFVMFLGWEGIGIVSYLLISYFYTRIQATKAALLALTMNRVGDMGMSIGFFAIFGILGSLNFASVFSVAPYINEIAITIISLLLFSGAMAKSAQLPLNTWLPGSMEAPTPVSALLHAATLVTAGIYLLLRSSPILSYSTDALLVITLIGSLTAFVAGSTALVQNDLKRIIAFSTISQLGYMMIALGLAQWNVALLHTILHAFFKALLFLSAGVIIHSLSDEQDIRKMGGLITFMPFIYSVMLIGTIALLGLPWLSGFYSKDLILELAYGKYQFSSVFAFILGTLTAFLTSFYSVRLINLVFLTVPNANKSSYLHIHSENLLVIIPLSILALFAIFLGFVASDFIGVGSDFFGNSLFIHPSHIHIIEAEFSLPLIIKLLPTIFSLLGGSLALVLYNLSSSPEFIVNMTNTVKFSKIFTPQTHSISVTNSVSSLTLEQPILRKIYTFLNGKYFFDIIYNNYLIGGALQISYTISKVLDRGIIELIGPFGLTEGSYSTGNFISKLDTGVITTYALYITLGLISILFLLFGVSPISNITEELESVNGVSDYLNSYNIKLLLISLSTTILYLLPRSA